MQPYESTALEPTVTGALRRFWWIVLIGGILGAVGGYLLAQSAATEYTAEASLIVEDPRAASLTVASPSPERYVSDQVAIIESTLVAEEASRLLAEEGIAVSPEDVQSGLAVGTFTNSNRIVVVFRAVTPEAAQRGADAIAAAYQEVRRSEARRNFEDALERLNRSLETLDVRVADAQDRLNELTEGDPLLEALEEQYRRALERLIALQDVEPLPPEEVADLTEAQRTDQQLTDAERRAQLDDVLQQLQTLQVVRSLQSGNPEVSELTEEQRLAVQRRDAVAQQRDQVALDAELAGSGVALVSPAAEAEEIGPDVERTAAVGAILGLLAGGSGAYLLSLRRRRIADRLEPEAVLGVPLIVDIPDFGADRVRSKLPVRTAPASASAESFRFVAAAMDTPRASDGDADAPARVFVFTSPLPGDGKTTITANTAFAAARRGWNVLAIDADFADQALTRLLLEGEQPTRGLSQILSGEGWMHDVGGLSPTQSGERWLHDVVQRLEVGGEASFDLLSRGSRPASASDMFRSVAAREFFARIGELYDIVLVDSPAVLHTAYASTLSSYADRALVVVTHRSRVSDLEVFRDRVGIVGTTLGGYVYNRAPLPFRASTDDGSYVEPRRRWYGLRR